MMICYIGNGDRSEDGSRCISHCEDGLMVHLRGGVLKLWTQECVWMTEIGCDGFHSTIGLIGMIMTLHRGRRDMLTLNCWSEDMKRCWIGDRTWREGILMCEVPWRWLWFIGGTEYWKLLEDTGMCMNDGDFFAQFSFDDKTDWNGSEDERERKTCRRWFVMEHGYYMPWR